MVGADVVMSHAVTLLPLGPDVSSYQHPNSATINWTDVATSGGQRFAIIKATEGLYYTNPYFSQDVAAAEQAGLFVGTYHYADPSTSPIQQADVFAQTIGTLADGNLPPVLDLEQTGGLSTSALQQWVQSFLTELQADTGRTPMIYSYPSFWFNSMGDTTQFTKYPLWIADYTTASSPDVFGGWSNFNLWQYTDQLTVAGIQGAVDDSRAAGGPVALAELAHADPNRMFLDSAALDTLGFTLAPATADQLDSEMNAGSVTRLQMASYYVGTDTWQARTISLAYEDVLGRHVDPSGLAHFLAELANGQTDEGMRAEMAGSPEFFNVEGGGTIQGFLAAAYQRLLGRPVDSSGEQAWANAMQHGMTPAQVALRLLQSTEGRTVQIDRAYVYVLRRAVDPSGLSHYLSALTANGGNLTPMYAQLLASQEYLVNIAETGVAGNAAGGTTSSPSTTTSPSPSPSPSPTG